MSTDTHDSHMREREQRLSRGQNVLEQISGHSILALADSLHDVSPELAYQTVAWAYGDIFARPVLGPRDRQLLTLGMLACQGGTETELRAHIPLALEVGLTRAEIVEVFIHAAVYCGFPRSINATKIAQQIFDEQGVTDECRQDAGAEARLA